MPPDDSKKLQAQTAKIVQDLRKETLEILQRYQSQEADFSKALAKLAEPYVQGIRQVHEVHDILGWWVEKNCEAIKTVQTFFSNMGQLGLQVAEALAEASKQLQATLKRADHIAKLGWTFPSNFYPKDLVHLAKLETKEDADAYVLRWYQENDPALERMEARICGNPAVAPFGTVLPQCFNSIRRGDFSIAIPSLIAVLENVILQLNPPNIVSRDVRKALRKGGFVAKHTEDDVFAAAVWLSLHTFVNELYVQIPAMSASVSPVLSRHVIQHGRLEAPNERVEAIRILHTIETALSLKDGSQLRKRANAKRLRANANDSKQQSFEHGTGEQRTR